MTKQLTLTIIGLDLYPEDDILTFEMRINELFFRIIGSELKILIIFTPGLL